MRRVVWALAAAVFATAGLSACGSRGAASVSAPQVDLHAPGAIVFVAGGLSRGLGVDNTDLVAVTPHGDIRGLTSTAAAENNATWSTDGSHVAFVRQWTTERESGTIDFHAGLYAWSPENGAPRRIASCSDVCTQHDLAWSPDDRHIAFASGSDTANGAIEVMNADGSGVHVVCNAKRCGPGLAMPMWSPDGRKLIFSNEAEVPENLRNSAQVSPSRIWVANANGAGVQKLTQSRCTMPVRPYPMPSRHTRQWRRQGCAYDAAPTWSPTGRLIAFTRLSLTFVLPAEPPFVTSLEVVRADGSHRTIIDTCGGGRCYHHLPPVWSPSGKAIAYTPNVDGGTSFRIATLGGTPTTIRTCAGSHCLFPYELTWSPSGAQLAFLAGSATSSDVWVVRRDGKAMHRVGQAPYGTCCLAWVRHLSLSGARAIPKLAGGGHPRLSGTIAYGSLLRGFADPLELLSLGTHTPHPIRVGSVQGHQPSWSPNGRELAYRSNNNNIYVSDRNGEHVRALTKVRRGAGTSPAWSPDGRTIAFGGQAGGIELVPAAGGPARALSRFGESPSWAPSGRELVFVGESRGALYTVRANGGGGQRLIDLPGAIYSPHWSPDGRKIAFYWSTSVGASFYLIRSDGTHLRRVTTAALPGISGLIDAAWSPDSRYLAVIASGDPRSRVSVIDIASGRISTVGTVLGVAFAPSWSPH